MGTEHPNGSSEKDSRIKDLEDEIDRLLRVNKALCESYESNCRAAEITIRAKYATLDDAGFIDRLRYLWSGRFPGDVS